MKKLILATLAVFTLSSGTVLAQSDAGAAVGGTAGGVSGAIAGGLIFGPIGAVIGGFTGAVIGASASCRYLHRVCAPQPDRTGHHRRRYRRRLCGARHYRAARDRWRSDHAYFYTNDRLYFVELEGADGRLLAGHRRRGERRNETGAARADRPRRRILAR